MPDFVRHAQNVHPHHGPQRGALNAGFPSVNNATGENADAAMPGGFIEGWGTAESRQVPGPASRPVGESGYTFEEARTPPTYGVPGGFDGLARRPSDQGSDVVRSSRGSWRGSVAASPLIDSTSSLTAVPDPLTSEERDRVAAAIREHVRARESLDRARNDELERLRQLERIDHQHRLELQSAREQWDREAASLREDRQLMRTEYETLRKESDQRAAEAQSEVRALQMQMQELMARNGPMMPPPMPPPSMRGFGGQPWMRRPGFDPSRGF